ncbi:NnrU family protein [Caenispirillum salinarum]|uniref:NnrU family protein n=1 Tax=Caenispirillum salinarum TaxID=859058 RepID=UPI00385098D0
MTPLVLACLLFLLPHLVITPTGARPALMNAMGERVYLVLYSALSLGALVWMGMAYGDAPYVPVWDPPVGMRHLSLILVPIAFVLMVLAVATPNPTSVGAQKVLEKGEARGIFGITRHPLMWAFILWAVAHLLANGDLASILLFGTIFVTAAVGMVLQDKRKSREAPEGFGRLKAHSSIIPFAALVSGRAKPALGWADAAKAAAGLVLFAVLLMSHRWLFGVSPLPM